MVINLSFDELQDDDKNENETVAFDANIYDTLVEHMFIGGLL